MRVEQWQSNLAAIWLAQVLSSVAFSFILPFIPLYVQTLGVNTPIEAAQWAGAISAAAAVSMTIAQPFWGALADRAGRKAMVIRSMVGGCVVIGLMGLARSPEQLLALRFLQGSITGVIAAATALVATSTPEHRLGFALGMNQVAAFLGTTIGPLIGGVISDTLGYRAAFFGASALLGFGGIVVIVLVRERFVPPPTGQTRRGVLSGARAIVALATFSTLLGVVFLIQLGGVIISPILTLFIADLGGSESAATLAGTVLAVTGAASAASAIVVGRVGDRVGHSVILPICLAGAAVTYFPQAAVQQVWQLLLLRLLLGVFLGGLMPSANALVARMVPKEQRGAAYGLTATASSAANGVGPLAGAAIATEWGMRAVFLATGALFALAAGWVTLGQRRRRDLPAPPADAVGVVAQGGGQSGGSGRRA